MLIALFYSSYLRWLCTSETWRLLTIEQRALFSQLLFEAISWRTPGSGHCGEVIFLRPFEIATNCSYLAELCGVPWKAVEVMLDALADEGLIVYEACSPSVLITMIDLRDSLPEGVIEAVEAYRATKRPGEEVLEGQVIDFAAARRRRGLRG